MGTEENLTQNLYGLIKISQEMAKKIFQQKSCTLSGQNY
jgi:hypothetical protein